MPADWYAANDSLDASEDCFEWHDILSTIESAGEKLVFAYLGCGYGRWLVNAALAARQLGKHARLLGVEAENQHYQWALECFADNGITDFTLINKPISDARQIVFFTQGHAHEWYGQAILATRDMGFGFWPEAEVAERKR